jgi:hypothetical protein
LGANPAAALSQETYIEHGNGANPIAGLWAAPV